MKQPIRSTEWINQFLRYEPSSGKLYWLPRPRHLCASERFYQIYKTRCEGKEALTADNGSGYRVGLVQGIKVRAHLAAWALYYGEWPEQPIDHINHDRADNRIKNLRLADATTNARNASLRHDNRSGRVGVHRHPSGLWQAQWNEHGRRIARYFHSFSDACAARAQFEATNGYHANHGKAA